MPDIQREARCPYCGNWSPVCWDDEVPPGGYWWSDGDGGCPRCGADVLVESECEFREATG
jgi:endogenous inhibitor of DNA gyrase (YacG/DUF329 family)